LQPRNPPPVTQACALHRQDILLLRLYCSTLTIPVQALLLGHAHKITPSIKCDNQFTCFNPTYCPVEQWLELSWEHCYSYPGVQSWKTSVIIVWCMCGHRQTMWRYRLWLWGPGLGKDLYIKWKIYVPGRQLLAV
jgi:hypothetical protein